MSFLERAEELLVGRATFPLTNYLLNRRGILSRYDELRRSEWYQPEQLRELQLRKLKQLIAYAYEQVPFYTERFRAIGMLPGDIRSLEDLRKVPPLSRQEVIDRRSDLVDRRLSDSLAAADGSLRGPGEPIPFAPFRRHKLVRNTSSGSTGAPSSTISDMAIFSFGRAPANQGAAANPINSRREGECLFTCRLYKPSSASAGRSDLRRMNARGAVVHRNVGPGRIIGPASTSGHATKCYVTTSEG